jgi:hypothetical protein
MGKPGRGHALSSGSECIAPRKSTRGSEPSQYPQEKKATAIPSVAASESGTAQTDQVPSLQALPDRCSGMLFDLFADRSRSYKSPI